MKNQSSKGQLTIFYSGVINVYDNVPVEKVLKLHLLLSIITLTYWEAMTNIFFTGEMMVLPTIDKNTLN